MLTLRDHGVGDYEALRHMDTTDVGDLSDDDRACLTELGEYLSSSEAWQRFGIWLPHKHFEPAPGEVFVEHSMRSPRRTETALKLWADFAEAELRTTAFRFDDSSEHGVALVGMEFAEPEDFGDTESLSDDDEAILTGICERLKAHDKIERFGVRLIRNPLGLAENELLHETCDSATKTMRCTVGERDVMLADQATIQTAWKWRVVEDGVHAVVMQDCTAGCVRVGEVHDVAHTASGTDDFDNPIEGGPNQPF
jgi:hypothetical protein